MELTDFIDLKILFHFNTILTAFLVLTLAIMILLFKKNGYLISLISSFLFSFYILVYKGDNTEKIKLILAMILFGLYGIITESLIISKTSVLEYKFPDYKLGINFPSYLFFIYASWVLIINLIFKLVKYI